jgi:hypothetical protein
MLCTGHNFPGGGTISPEGPFGYVTIGNAPKLLLLNAPTNVRLAGGGGEERQGISNKILCQIPYLRDSSARSNRSYPEAIKTVLKRFLKLNNS